MTYGPEQIQTRAIQYLQQYLPAALGAASMGRPVLYGADNRPLPPSPVYYSKRAAGNIGSMRNWRPRQLNSEDQISREREAVQSRICDLVGSDPHAAGVVNTFPQTVVGSGLYPNPRIDDTLLNITREQAEAIEHQQRLVNSRWWNHADASGKMTFGEIQYLWEKCLIQYGEFLALAHMRQRPGRRYHLCIRVLNPMRMKTPLDKRNSNVQDGVELNGTGEAEAVWIKKSEPGRMLSDISQNFARIPVKNGHRWLVLHDFVTEDPEQYRGVSPLASCIKGFKDLSDFLNAELVSNVVTAAFSMFIELQHGQNPFDVATNAADLYDINHTQAKDNKSRYQELIPGAIMYGNLGERPHPIAARRPGATFQPFVREIKKAFAHGLGLPYPVAFKDVDGVSFAGFRSAMLEAWRVFSWRRSRLGRGTSQKVWNMLQEEAWLMGDLQIPGDAESFYRDMDAWCQCEWHGAPKGDIEPYAAAKSDLLLWDYNAKTLERIILENGGGNPTSVKRQVEKEKKELAAQGVMPAKSQAGEDSELGSGNKKDDAGPDGEGE